MDKLKMHSPDLTQAHIARLRELFPGCVTEAKGEDGAVRLAVDFDLLRQELSGTLVEGPQERYQLNWPGKREALLTANAPIAKTLRPCRDESVDFDSTKNLFIEGDNLDALKLLQETYLGKVKLIYIDPPYNTGNDFVYDDNFAESTPEYLVKARQITDDSLRLVSNKESNGRFHSVWLDMILPRLRVARKLLRDDGVIMISIDDREVANLRKICDEVFGPTNFEGALIWQRKQSPQRDATNISATHDYILVFAKRHPTDRGDRAGWLARLLPMGEEQLARYKNPDNDARGPWASMDLTINTTAQQRPNKFFPIVNPNTSTEVMPSPNRTWIFDKFTMQKVIEEGRIWWGERGTNFPRLKAFLSENQQGVRPQTLLLRDTVGDNQAATRELNVLFPEGVVFDTPKPTSLIKYLCHIANAQGNDIVMDFFAGSATTADAVLQMNADDNGARRFILVQAAERYDENSSAASLGFKTISDAAKERVRRAGESIRKQASDKPETLDTGFRVLKIDSSNMADVFYAPDAVNQAALEGFTDNIKPDRTAEDLLFQVMLDWGVDLALPITRQTILSREVLFVDGNALAACFDAGGRIDEAFVKELATHMPLRAVFRDAGFADSAAKINVEQIFKLLSPATEVKCI